MTQLAFNPFTGEFDFVGSTDEASDRIGVALVGSTNGSNAVFTTPEKFVHSATDTIRVFYNGLRMKQGSDYAVSESSGPGTGYDTVTILRTKKPQPGDLLTADYTKA